MSLHLHTVNSHHAVVLRPRGRVILGHGARTLRHAARRAAASGRDVALDLTRVTEIDAHGIGTIAALCAAAQSAGTSITLDGASARVTRLLRLTRLDSVLPNFSRAATHASSAPASTRPCTAR